MTKLINNDAMVELDKLIAERERERGDVAIITDLPYGKTQNSIDVKLPTKELWNKIDNLANTFITTAQTDFMVELVSNKPKGWKWFDLVWDKQIASGFLNANRQPLRKHENILVFYKGKLTYNPQFTDGAEPLHSRGTAYLEKPINNQNYGAFKNIERPTNKKDTQRYPTSIISIGKTHPSKAVHATQKPVELYEWLIKNFTDENDLVVDITMGSGTTGVAAKNTNRKFIGIEKDEKYYNIAVSRIEGE